MIDDFPNLISCEHKDTSPIYFIGVTGPQMLWCNDCKKEVDPFKEALAKRLSEVIE